MSKHHIILEDASGECIGTIDSDEQPAPFIRNDGRTYGRSTSPSVPDFLGVHDWVWRYVEVPTDSDKEKIRAIVDLVIKHTGAQVSHMNVEPGADPLVLNAVSAVEDMLELQRMAIADDNNKFTPLVMAEAELRERFKVEGINDFLEHLDQLLEAAASVVDCIDDAADASPDGVAARMREGSFDGDYKVPAPKMHALRTLLRR